MKKLPISLFCGGAAIVATVILYFTVFASVFTQIVHLIALFGVVLAEAITAAFFYCSQGRPRRVAAAIVSAFLIPISMILSVVYVINFPGGYVTYIGLYSACLVIIVAIAGILFKFDDKREKDNAQLQLAKSNVLAMRKYVRSIVLNPAAAPHKDALDELEEKLHFSCDNVVTEQDERIWEQLKELKEKIGEQEFCAEEAIRILVQLVDERRIAAQRNV